MSAKQRRYTERAQRVDLYMDAQAEDFSAGSKGGVAAARLKEELVNLSALDVARLAGASKLQQGTTGRRGVRGGLRELVLMVSDTAGIVALDRSDVKGIFSLSDADRSDRMLVATARNFADALAPLVNLFAEYGLPATIIDDLRSKADSLEHYISLQTEGLGGRVNANSSVEATIRNLNGLVERLDTLVRNKYRGDTAKLAAWEHASRVESAPRPKDAPANTPPPPVND